MSELRRKRQVERATPSLGSRIIFSIRKRWKWVVAILLGSAGLGEIFRIWLQEKFLDWTLARLGSIGVWMVSYKFASLTFALMFVILWLVASALREAYIPKNSAIVDLQGNQFQTMPLSKAWSAGFLIVAVFCVLFIGYGALEYYRTRPLLNKYPLGYVIFTGDFITNAVTPLETRRGLEAYQYDFRPVRITQNTPDRIAVRLPDVIKNKALALTGVETGGWKRVGNLGGAVIGDDKGMIFEWAEILAIKDSQITFLVGFTRAGPLPKA